MHFDPMIVATVGLVKLFMAHHMIIQLEANYKSN